MAMLCLALAVSALLRVFGFVTEPWLNDSQIHRVDGEPARLTKSDPRTEPVKLVTWNIERGAAYDSILRTLGRLDADVLLLQEVDRGCRRSGYRNVARDLAHSLQMNWVFAGEFQEIGEGRGNQPGVTGQAILSRFPIDEADALRFASQARWKWSLNPVQPRRGGRLTLRGRTGGLVVYNTHIESGHNDALQHRQVREILARHSREPRGTPTVIGGDFNNGPVLRWSALGELGEAEFADALGELGGRDQTAYGQSHPIDWIFVKNLRPLRGRVVAVRNASDHFPVIAALAFTSPVVAHP